MPKINEPQTFDQHLGAVIGGLARPHGGRPFLVSLLGWSKGTVDRRMAGTAPFLMKEIEIVARALHTTPAAIGEQALRNYGGGSEEEGMKKLIAEESEPVSPAPVSLDERRSKSIADMTDEELEGLRSVANTDPEIGYDEPEAP